MPDEWIGRPAIRQSGAIRFKFYEIPTLFQIANPFFDFRRSFGQQTNELLRQLGALFLRQLRQGPIQDLDVRRAVALVSLQIQIGIYEIDRPPTCLQILYDPI